MQPEHYFLVTFPSVRCQMEKVLGFFKTQNKFTEVDDQTCNTKGNLSDILDFGKKKYERQPNFDLKVDVLFGYIRRETC